MTITPEEIRTSKFKAVMFLDYAKGGYGQHYASTRWPDLWVKHYKAHRTAKLISQWGVGELRVPWGDYDQMAELLNAREEGA